MQYRFMESKWFERVFTAILAVGGVLLTQSFMSRRDISNNIQSELSKKATIEYVNTMNTEQRVYVDNRYESLSSALKQHLDESEKAEKMQTELIKSIDSKVNVLLNRSK